MSVSGGRLVALVVALGYVIAVAVATRDPAGVFWTAVAASFPVSLIWFPELWGEPGARMRGTPAGFVTAAGWAVLAGMPLALLWLGRRPGN